MNHKPNALEVYYADSRVGWLNNIDGSIGVLRTIQIDQTLNCGGFDEDAITDSRAFTLSKRCWDINVDRLRVWSPETREREIRANAPIYAKREHFYNTDIERFSWATLHLFEVEELEWLFDYEHFVLAECPEPDMDTRGVMPSGLAGTKIDLTIIDEVTRGLSEGVWRDLCFGSPAPAMPLPFHSRTDSWTDSWEMLKTRFESSFAPVRLDTRSIITLDPTS